MSLGGPTTSGGAWQDCCSKAVAARSQCGCTQGEIFTATANSSSVQRDKRGGSALGQNWQPLTTRGPFSLPSSAAPGSLGFIQPEWWRNLVPIRSAELNGAFYPGRQGCHYPSSRSCTRRSNGLWILTPSAPLVRAEEHKRPRSKAELLSKGQEKQENKSFARIIR